MLYAGGVLSSPRKVYVIKTNHFEIIFPKESAETAHFIAEYADSLYEEAKSQTGLQKDFAMPLIISPDSSVLDVKYTNRPYNRIVIFDAVADNTQTGSAMGGDQILLKLLYKEIFRAVSCSVRSPFNEFVYKYVLGDPYQPTAFINLPFSFVEAYSDLASGAANDQYFQQLLIQAKLEGKFPTWFQAAAIRDIHPGNDLCYAASTGFAAYLMQSRGVEKYAEFWNECGKLHPYFLNGIFYKVYGKLLFEVWKEFEESVPLPEDMEEMQAIEAMSREVSENDRQGAFENILYTNYGVVWYDSIRHEVDIFDANSFFKIRQLLFIADDITKLSLSPNGRYVSASFTRGTSRTEFKEDVTCIFDLKDRKFLSQKFPVRDASFIEGEAGAFYIAGLDVKQKQPVLKVYSFKTDKAGYEEIFEKSFERTDSVYSITSAGEGNIAYLYSNEEGTSLVVDLQQFWSLTDENGNQITPFSLRYIKASALFTFSYYPDLPEDEGALVRSGYITLKQQEDKPLLEKVFVQKDDVSGGVYYPFIANGKLYYCAKKYSHNELRYLQLDQLAFSEGVVEEKTLESEETDLDEEPEVDFNKPELRLAEKRLGEYDLKMYNPLKYMLDISFTPLLAIRDITIEKGPVYWPSLGVYISADSDPLRNTELIRLPCAFF